MPREIGVCPYFSWQAPALSAHLPSPPQKLLLHSCESAQAAPSAFSGWHCPAPSQYAVPSRHSLSTQGPDAGGSAQGGDLALVGLRSAPEEMSAAD